MIPHAYTILRSTNTADNAPKVSTLNIVLAIRASSCSTSADAPALGQLADDLSWSAAYDRVRWDDHVRWDDRVRQDLHVLANDAEWLQDTFLADVDMITNIHSFDDRAGAYKDVVADLEWIVGYLAFRDSMRWLDDAASTDDGTPPDAYRGWRTFPAARL